MKKNLQTWLNEGRLQQHKTSVKEIADLLKVVDRDLADAAIKEISADRRFATAYNAALQLATIVLHASGYRTGKAGHHWVTFKSLPEVMGPEAQERADYFNSCRSTRNVTDIPGIGGPSRWGRAFCCLQGSTRRFWMAKRESSALLRRLSFFSRRRR